MSKTQKFKKIAPILLIVAILISIIGGGTLAYINREARAENTITAGDIKVKLYNMRDDGTTMPKDGIHSVLANITYPNVVYAKNECDYPEYIRMRVSKQVTDKDGTKLDSSKMHPKFNEEDWTYSEKDGYYYYNQVLAPHTNSAPLYDGIYFDKTIDNTYKTATLHMNIIVEAVQSDNNGNGVFDAEGWEVKDAS